MQLPKAYMPKEYEDKIYQKWEKSGYFNPDNLPIAKKLKAISYKLKPFSISMPPPNATGVLHVGHTLGITVQDIMTRYHRMKGDKTLLLPGTDHAAIATQNVVERLLRKKGTSRHKLGRHKFLKRTREYVEQNKSTINNQTRKMGASCDWSREAYTMSDELSLAVNTQFKNMYEHGLIYRGDRIVNWCPRCHSTLADDEVEYKEQRTKFYTFKYTKNFPISIATTRPETKLGDMAIAINPDDKRYKKYIGQEFEIDFVGVPLKIKIIGDKNIDPEFGTGAVGITPAHSMADWQMAEKNNLEIKKVIGQDGKIVDNLGEYSGLGVEKARQKVVANLKKEKLISKEEEIENKLSLCYRCNTPVEPLPSLQWFIAVDKEFKIKNKELIKKYGKDKTTLKEISVWAVKSGEIKIIPEHFKKTYFHWMENLRDWCISRQIWFGHRIPVWYKSKNQENKKTRKQENNRAMQQWNNGTVDITYFVHGTTTDNEENKNTGWNHGELSKLGKQQNLELKQALAKRGDHYDIVFTSDLKRAKESAKTIFGNKTIADKRLRECNYGNLNGKSEKEFKDDKYYIDHQHPNGESYQDVEKRIREFLEDISKKYAGKKIAIVAHKIPQLALEVITNKKTWQQAVQQDWRKEKKWQPGWKYVYTNNEIYIDTKPPKGKNWTQDEDTLDTWFSSALWTWSTLLERKNYKKYKTFEDWVMASPDLKNFHPTDVMETMHDILFFWVARMIMMTLYALNEVPFKTVYLHGMICDKHGKKMSKSDPETCIEPIEVAEKYGTDALRLSLVIGNSAGNKLNLSEQKIAGFRNFANKLWNIGRFIQMMSHNVGAGLAPAQVIARVAPKTLADKWILSRLNSLTDEVTEDLEHFRFSLAGEKLYDFTWHTLADWYVEIVKIQNNQSSYNLLFNIYNLLLKLLHPFTPFVTEKIWEYFNPPKPWRRGAGPKLLMVEEWPKVDNKKINAQVEQDFGLIQELITAMRSWRKSASDGKKPASPAGRDPKEILKVKIAGAADLIKKQKEIINKLARVDLESVKALTDKDLEVENLKIKF